jgi:hypothetical protein
MTTIEQDFETVSHNLTISGYQCDGAGSYMHEHDDCGHAALSRIEAALGRQTLKAVAALYDERDALRAALGPLYRFVMESRYVRNIAVPSGVLDRARQALEELSS